MTLQGGAEVVVERREGSLEHLGSGNHNQIEPGRGLIPPKNLSNQPFSSVPQNRAAEPPGSADAEPGLPGSIRQRNERQEAPLRSGAPLLDAQVIGPPADAFWGPEALGHLPAGLSPR
jgi:hypothetical protein